MKKFLVLLGTLWLSPISIPVWLFYILPGWFFGAIRWDGWHSFLIARFALKNSESPYASLWKDWYGWSGPNVMVIKWNAKGRTQRHEYRHCLQQLILGPFFYPAYFLNSAVTWLMGYFVGDARHAYYDNFFERDARGYAGQPLYIDRDEWKHGPNDRWPWW